MNKWRSPTAETLFQRYDGVCTRSAGTSRKARHPVSIQDIRWAEVICGMEPKHMARLRGDFRDALRHKEVHVLDIPDEYRFMDPELVALLRDAIGPILER